MFHDSDRFDDKTKIRYNLQLIMDRFQGDRVRIAEYCGIHPSTLSSIMSGRMNLKATICKKICEYTDTEPSQIIGYESKATQELRREVEELRDLVRDISSILERYRTFQRRFESLPPACDKPEIIESLQGDEEEIDRLMDS